jgi:Ca2+-binding RTX toxin-like protein
VLGTGADTITAGGATSIVAGNAQVTVTAAAAVSITGGTGSITLIGHAGGAYVFTQVGTRNTLSLGSGVNSVLSHGADTISASTASGAGATSIYAAGPALITGGSGTLSVNGRNSAVTVRGGTGAVTASAIGDNSYLQGGSLGHNVLNASGSNTTLVGGGGGDTLSDTGAGNNLLQAGAGAETLSAGAGQDTLIGGAGADVFVLTALAAGSAARDIVIKAFQPGTDQLRLAGFGTSTPIASKAVAGGNLQLILTDHSNVTLIGITSLS